MICGVKEMKKILSSFLIGISVIAVCVGCGNTETSKSYEFKVDNGDVIKIQLDTSDGYNITSDVPFEITCDDEIHTQGMFIEKEQVVDFVEAVASDPNATYIDSGNKDDNEYTFWSYNNEEFNIVVNIENSNTGVILGNIISEDSAKECFDRLTISMVK